MNAIKQAIEKQYTKIAIFTDSLISCQLLDKVHTNNKCSTEIHKLIIENKITTHIGWTPSHIGIKANELADTIAKIVTESLRIIKTKIRNEWYNNFQDDSVTKSLSTNLYKIYTTTHLVRQIYTLTQTN